MFTERESAELKGLQEALRGLAPAPATVPREELMFRAGQASARADRWRWPTVAALLGLATTLLGIGQFLRPTPEPIVIEKIVQVTIKEPAPPAPVAPPLRDGPPTVPEAVTVATSGQSLEPTWPVARATYLKLRQDVIRWGPEIIPPFTPAEFNRPPLRPVDLLRNGFQMD